MDLSVVAFIQAAQMFSKQFIQTNLPQAASFPDRSGSSPFTELPLEYHFFLEALICEVTLIGY